MTPSMIVNENDELVFSFDGGWFPETEFREKRFKCEVAHVTKERFHFCSMSPRIVSADQYDGRVPFTGSGFFESNVDRFFDGVPDEDGLYLSRKSGYEKSSDHCWVERTGRIQIVV